MMKKFALFAMMAWVVKKSRIWNADMFFMQGFVYSNFIQLTYVQLKTIVIKFLSSALWLHDLLLPFSALNSGCMAEKWLVPRVEGWCCFPRNFPNWESSSGTLISLTSMWGFYGSQGFVTQRTVNYASFYICFALHRKCISKGEAILL